MPALRALTAAHVDLDATSSFRLALLSRDGPGRVTRDFGDLASGSLALMQCRAQRAGLVAFRAKEA